VTARWATATAFLAAVAFATAVHAQDLVVRAGTILPIAGDPIRNGVLVVRDGKVAAVGADVAVPAGVPVVELPQSTIMPGLIDANAWEGCRGQLSEESREVFPSYKVARALDPDSPQLRQLAQRGTTAVCLSPGHHAVIGGLCAVVQTAGPTREAMVVTDRAALQAVVGWEASAGNRIPWRESPDTFYYRRPTTRTGVVWELRKAFFSVTEEGQPAPDPADAEVLRAVVAGQLPLRVAVRRMIDIETTFRIADEFGLHNLVLEEAFEAFKVADEIARRNVPVVLSNLFYLGDGQPQTPEMHLNNAGILAKAGVKIAFGTALSDGRPDLLTCAAIAHRYGLPRDDCLKALTVNAAEILGVADRIGSLVPGKDADFVVLSGDPLSVTSRVEQTYLAGKQVYNLR